MKRTHSMLTVTAAIALGCAAPLAFAQTATSSPQDSMQHPQSGAMTHTPPMQSTPMQQQNMQKQDKGMQDNAMQGNGMVMGKHDMTGMVTQVKSNGVVYVTTAGMHLRIHFPGASQQLKKGDKITLHLSYTKDSNSSDSNWPASSSSSSM